MSIPNSPLADETPNPHHISPEALALAAERRNQQQPAGPSHAKLTEEHEKRQAFRRLINPGIFERNSREVYTAAVKTLSTLAENLLREPANPHYQQFKPTNHIIKQRLVDPKGTLEYAIAMGFRAEVKNFQPFYIFNPHKMDDLRVGAAMLKEAMDLQSQKDERAVKSMQEEKAAREAAALKVKLAFMDDRRTKTLNDERERELREARAVAAAAAKEHKTDGLAPMSVLPPTSDDRSPSPSVSDDD